MLIPCENICVEKGQKIQVLIGLTGVGVMIAKWGLDTVFIQSPEMFAVGRFNFVASCYGVAVLYSLWEMFKPPWMHLPDYCKSKYHSGAGFQESLWYLMKKKKKD